MANLMQSSTRYDEEPINQTPLSKPMKKAIFFGSLFAGLLSTSRGGLGVDHVTLAGNYAGSWSSLDLARSGTLSVTFNPDGQIEGEWLDPSKGGRFVVDRGKSWFNGSNLYIKLIDGDLYETDIFEGALTKSESTLTL
jgi:hypothetical protein